MGTSTVLSKLGNFTAFLIPALLAMATLHEGSRMAIRDMLQPEYRTVLSTAFGDVLGDGTPVRVMKIKTREGLFLEIYKATNYELIQQLPLGQTHDGFFTFQGTSANLAIADVDGDHVPEILVSSYDENLSAHLNVYRYDHDTHFFYRLTNEYQLKLTNL